MANIKFVPITAMLETPEKDITIESDVKTSDQSADQPSSSSAQGNVESKQTSSTQDKPMVKMEGKLQEETTEEDEKQQALIRRAVDRMDAAAESGKENLSQAMEQAKDFAHSIQETAGSLLGQVKEGGSKMLDKVGAPDVSKTLGMENAGEALEQSKHMAEKTLKYISDLAATTKEKLTISAGKAKTSTTGFLDTLQEGLNQITDTAGQLGQKVQEKTPDASQKIDTDFGVAGEQAQQLSTAGEHYERSE